MGPGQPWAAGEVGSGSWDFRAGNDVMVPPLPQVGEVQAWLRIWGMSVGVGCESPSLSSAAAQVLTCRGHLGESRNPRSPGEEKLGAGEEEEKRDSEPQVCWFTLDPPPHTWFPIVPSCTCSLAHTQPLSYARVWSITHRQAYSPIMFTLNLPTPHPSAHCH